MSFHIQPAGTWQRALVLAKLVQALRGTNPQREIEGLMISECGGFDSSMYRPSTDVRPAFWHGRVGADSMLIADGSSRDSHTSGIVAGYLGGPLDSASQPENEFFKNAAVSIRQELEAAGLGGTTICHMAGWSFGGAALSWMPIVANGTPWNAVAYRLDTFGAPRAYGTSRRSFVLGRCVAHRWMNDNDPIPMMPPTPELWAQFISFIGVALGVRASNFVHAGDGHVIAENGSIEGAVLPTNPNMGTGTSFASWLFGFDNANGPEHGMAGYVGRLASSVNFYRHGATPVERTRERPASTGVQAMNATERAFVNSIARTERIQTGQAVVIPPTMRLRARRISRVWFVLYGDKTICMPGSKRAAIAFAREGNRWMRRMLRTAVMDPAAIQTALTAYFAAAQDRASGISPIMNTTVPQP